MPNGRRKMGTGRMRKRFAIPPFVLRPSTILILLLAVPVPALAQVLVTGRVLDDATGEGLAAAHVTVAGTTTGTITNAAGAFRLNVARLPVTLEVRHIGYATARAEATPERWQDLTIRLEPRVYQLGEVVVGTPDVAANIMRKVIAAKQRRQAGLRTYRADGFTRLTLARDSTVVLIAESVFDVYWDRDRGPREVITAQRQTADFHERLGIPAAGHVPNLYADLVPVRGLSMIGPTHPDALDHYTFTLAGTRALGDAVVYDLYVAPRTTLAPTFIGTVSVLDSVYALVEATLRPARHVPFPAPTRAWAVFYRQQFAPVEGIWLPIDARLEGTAHVEPDGQPLRPFHLTQVSQLSGHAVNVPLPEALYARAQRVTMDTAAVMSDPLFLTGRYLVPMTPREAQALERLQARPMTLARALAPTSRIPPWLDLRGDPFDKEGPQFAWPVVRGVYQAAVRFNRVDGYLGAIGQVLPFGERLRLDWRLGQASGLERVRYHAGGRYRWGRGGTLAAAYDVDTDHRLASHVYPTGLNSLVALLGGGDYFDYLWSRRLRVEGRYAFPRVRLGLTVRHEEQEPVDRRQRRAWLGEAMRPNPPVEAGTLRSVTLALATGDGRRPLRTGPLNRLALEVEHSLPGAGSTWAFTRFTAHLDGAVPTFYRRRLEPNTLEVRLIGATFRGTLPPQRLAALDGRLGAFAAFGAFRGRRGPYEGEQALGLFWAHDFRTAPFEWLGLWPLAERRMGLRLFGAHGRTWLADARRAALPFSPAVADAWHHEIGLALTHLAGTPLRLDLTRRLDAPGWFVTVGLSRLPW